MNTPLKNRDSNVFKYGLLYRLIFILSIFMVFLIIVYFLADKHLKTKQYDSLVVNAAALQRTRIQQYTSEIHKVLVNLATSDLDRALQNKKKSNLTALAFEKNMKALIDGGVVNVSIDVNNDKLKAHDDSYYHEYDNVYNDISIPAVNDANIKYHLEHTFEDWAELKRLSLLSLRSNVNDMANSIYIKKLLSQSDKTVLHMDYVVQLMLQDSERKLKKLDELLLLMLVFGAVTFVIITYFVFKKIILPLGVSIDEYKLLSEKLIEEKKRAEKASSVKSDFLSSMSHELRTPMNAMLGFAQMLKLDEDSLTKTQISNIDEILVAGEHLLTLINDVLDLSKIESGNVKMDLEEVCLADLIPECVAMIRPRTRLRNIEIIDRISGQNICIFADRRRLKQVIANLLSNAEKYNKDNGDIFIDYEYVNNNNIVVKITDTGCGISKENIDKLFIPFERLDKKNNIEGTGIGLVVTKELVELMSGTIGVESSKGEGSTFWVELKIFN